MILALINNVERYQFLFKQLGRQPIPVVIFESVSKIQRWLELNQEPKGLLVDCSTPVFEDFLIRFTLQHTDIPALLLSDQTEDQLDLRSRLFVERLNRKHTIIDRGRLLLVDDSKTIRIRYKKILEADGFQVDLAQDAEQGLQKALHGHYDLAIIDYFMPGDNGAQLCQKLQAHEDTSELVCSILTGQYEESIVDECLKAGARECMFKNESIELFRARVTALHRSLQRKQQIEKERSRLIGLLDSVAEGVYGVTSDGRIQFVNPATLRLLGCSVVDLLGRYPHDCIHPVDSGGQPTSAEMCFLQQAYLFGDELREWRTLFSRADGSLFPVECSVTLQGDNTEDTEENEGTVVVFRDISEQKKLEKNWQWQLNHDHLTGLLNRNAFEEILEKELGRVKRSREPSLILFIDLDRFKVINDELGHAAGDQLLVNLAEQLKNRARNTDQVARLSGDEFVVLLSSVSRGELEELAEKYRLLLEQTTLQWKGKEYKVTGSVGVAILDRESGSLIEMLARADLACQQAKQKGRNQWALYSKNAEAQTQQGNWHQRLNSAIENNNFTLLEQPVFDAVNVSEQVGSECLLRLKEGMAFIAPTLFMSNAKRFGLMLKIDRLMIDNLVEYCQKFIQNDKLVSQKKQPPDKQLTVKQWFSVNLSVESLSNEVFRNELPDVWKDSGLTNSQLVIEIEEEELFKFPDWQQCLAQLRQKGFRIAIDHFGMSIQSLLNLPQMPVDIIKLDTALTRDLAANLARSNLIDAIVTTAKQNKVDTIALHVETAEELDLLQARSINFIQGFYLGKPIEFDKN